MNTLRHKLRPYLYLLLGAGLYTLVTWRWNVPIAAWLAPIFLIRFWRAQSKWYAALPAVLLIWAAVAVNKTGGWPMEPWLEVVSFLIAASPLIVALFADRFTAPRLSGVARTLVFPATFVTLDYIISILPLGLGTSLTLAPSQFYNQPLLQVAALTGIWGIEFLVLWAAPVINALWERGFDIRPVRGVVTVYAVVLVGTLIYGGLRLVVERPESATVRVAGVTVAHNRNYWDVWLDRGTPQDQVQTALLELTVLEDDLFAQSEQAVHSGAKIIFWSEGDAVITPEHKADFFKRAQDFAREHQVYLMPAYLLLRYGDTSGLNGLTLLTPQGAIAYEYEKTMSWYATTSDGALHSVETPYGRLASVICFDLDFPELVRQATEQQVDIMLVPAFDTYLTRLYHTEVGLPRSVENGFSTMRMVNEGTSMAVDYRGQLLASQDFFTTPSRIMFADLPTRGIRTLYGQLGDWFAWLTIILTTGLIGSAARRRTIKL